MPRWRTLAPGEVDVAVTDGVVMLDFLQERCPPCHALEPRLEAFARRHHQELEILQVDIDEDTETPQRFAVMSIPTLILFRDGHEVARLDGLIGDEDPELALEEDKEGGMPDSDRSAVRDLRPVASEFSRGRRATARGSGPRCKKAGDGSAAVYSM